MARDFDTPARLRRALLKSKLKTLKCAYCGNEFKQNAPAQRFCNERCMMTPRPWQPKVKKIFDDFYEFCKSHSIPRANVIPDRLWQDTWREERQWRHNRTTDQLRAKIAVQFKMVMDRFRRGFYIVTADGIQFQNPPWLPYCPVDHTYCKGAILPHDCPRRHPECAYNKGTWKEICQLRGLYEIDVDKNASRNFDRRGGRPLIGFKLGTKKPDESKIRADAATGETPRAKTADDHRLSHGRNSL